MVPKKADYNRVVEVGDGNCHVCHGDGEISQIRSTHPCASCKGTGACHMCGGKGVRFDRSCGYCESNYEKAAEKFYDAVTKNTSIDDALKAISQEEAANRVWKRCAATRESFSSPITVSTRKEYEEVLGRFMRHYSKETMYHDNMDPDRPHVAADIILGKIHGNSARPFKIACSGEGGGMKLLLDQVHQFAQESMTARILKNFLSDFQLPERERLLREYIKQYGHLGKYKGQTVIQLLFNFEEVMAYHVNVIDPALRAEAGRS